MHAWGRHLCCSFTFSYIKNIAFHLDIQCYSKLSFYFQVSSKICEVYEYLKKGDSSSVHAILKSLPSYSPQQFSVQEDEVENEVSS